MSGAGMGAIEVFADVWCPFAHVGLQMVADERRRLGRAEVPIVVRAWPLELVNGAPMDPTKTAHHVHDLREQLVPDMFGAFGTTCFPSSTLPALALTAAAYRVGAAAGERAAFAVRRALFEEGRDVADPQVIVDLASELNVPTPTNVDHATVLADYEEGKRRGVIGSPHFFCGSAHSFCPSLQLSRDNDQQLHIRLDPTRLREFLVTCLR